MQEVIEDMPRPIKIKIKINCHLGFLVYPTSLLAQTVRPRLRMLREALLLCARLLLRARGSETKEGEQVSFGVSSPLSDAEKCLVAFK